MKSFDRHKRSQTRYSNHKSTDPQFVDRNAYSSQRSKRHFELTDHNISLFQNSNKNHKYQSPYSSRKQIKNSSFENEVNDKKSQNIKFHEFLNAILSNQMQDQYTNNNFIKVLNGTWFQSTKCQQINASKMCNTIGFKKSRIFNPQRKLINNEQDLNKIDFTRQIKQPGLFPRRKSAIPKRVYGKSQNKSINRSPSIPLFKNEGVFKSIVMRNISRQEQRVTKSPAKSSRQISMKNSSVFQAFKNDRLVNRNMQPVVKGFKAVIHN